MDSRILPIFASPLTAFITFIITLLFSHLIFIWFKPLGRVGWRRIDYIWLLCALFGVIGGAVTFRKDIATDLLSVRERLIRFPVQEIEGD